MQPLPTQITGAKFLADRKTALLADEPRCGKTGAAIIGADYIFARRILVVTTASGRSVWQRAFPTWSVFPRAVQVVSTTKPLKADTDVAIVGWGGIRNPKLRTALLKVKWDLIISDEDHWAKSFDSQRTQAFYGQIENDGARVLVSIALASKGAVVWCLTGTPLPNSPIDAYPRLRVLAVERLLANPAKGWPEVVKFKDFLNRYCDWFPMKVGHGSWAKQTIVVRRGRNEEELAARMGDFMLLRTQKDVGIRPPVYETFPLEVSPKVRREIDAGSDLQKMLQAADDNNTADLEMALGPKRRLIGQVKAMAVIEAVKDEFAGGLDKIVLAFWHKDVARVLAEGLDQFDGSSSANDRLNAELTFRHPDGPKVFLAQIVAAGEAIDLSAAAELLFVETSFVPKDMRQMSDRITNVTQARLTRVRVATLEGSIDDALQATLMRKWSSIRKVLS